MNSSKKDLSQSEWTKEAVSALIKEYEKHINLYDPKSSHYYNKLARKKSLDKIVAKVNEHRSGTTEHDVYKKFQTLRTQYGQEVAKIRKSASIDEEFAYRPKIWWWEPLSFLKPFIKCRTVSYIVKSDNMNEDDNMDEIHLEIPESSAPARKKTRKSENEEVTYITNEEEKEKYIIYEEPASTNENEEQREIVVEPYPSTSNASTSHSEPDALKRHEEIGRFVAAQMAMITDDVLFYKTQLEILTVVSKAQMKQLEKRSARSVIIDAAEEDIIIA